MSTTRCPLAHPRCRVRFKSAWRRNLCACGSWATGSGQSGKMGIKIIAGRLRRLGSYCLHHCGKDSVSFILEVKVAGVSVSPGKR